MVGRAQLVLDRDQMRRFDRPDIDLTTPTGTAHTWARVDAGQLKITQQRFGAGKAAGYEPLPRFPI